MPKPLAFDSPKDLLAQLIPHRDGVILELGGHGATFLPAVWEEVPEKEDFLGDLCTKAGLDVLAWRNPDIHIRVYGAEEISENEI